MDNICHTLVGASIAECGGRKWTPLATATVLIGANLPDVDAVTYFGDHVTALGFRRGWTHGILAVAVWPFILAGLMLAWDRYVRRRRNPHAAPAVPRPLLLLAFLSVLSHPLLDLCNTYGVRLLMPFSARWFYGDALFIVDPWVWLALAAGIVISRVMAHRGSARPLRAARVASVLTFAYIVAMAVASRVAAQHVSDHFTQERQVTGVRVMMAPEFANPFTREVVVRLAGGYIIGSWDWRRVRHPSGAWDQVIVSDSNAAAAVAAGTPRGRRFLSWSRFPVFSPAGRNGCPARSFCIGDARYPGQAWAQVAIPLDSAVSSSPSP